MTTTTTTAAEVAILGHLHCATHYAGPFPGSYNYSSQPHFTDENTDLRVLKSVAKYLTLPEVEII